MFAPFKKKRGRTKSTPPTFWAFVLALSILVLRYINNKFHLGSRDDATTLTYYVHTDESSTLVLFAYQECGPVCIRNLEYFINVGIWDTQGVHYIIIVNGDVCSPCTSRKDILAASNVSIYFREDQGADFGAYTYALNLQNLEDYQYFVFLNAGVKGPILPLYDMEKLPHWPKIFTSRLNKGVKLVGPSISCEIATHVQSHMFATDSEGLSLGFEYGVFHIAEGSDTSDALIAKSEIGFSQNLLRDGYQIDSLLIRYAYTDWKKDSPACNQRANPLKSQLYHTEGYGDISVDPLQQIFVKRGGKLRDCEYGCHDTDSLIDATADWFEAAVEHFRARRIVKQIMQQRP